MNNRKDEFLWQLITQKNIQVKLMKDFQKEAMSMGAVNQDYDFVGAQTVHVYSVPTAPMHDYTKTGLSRYGTPEELENSVQEMTMSQDRSFTFTIDKGNFTDTQMVNAAGAALNRQLREVVIPEKEQEPFLNIFANAGTHRCTEELQKTVAYVAFLTVL